VPEIRDLGKTNRLGGRKWGKWFSKEEQRDCNFSLSVLRGRRKALPLDRAGGLGGRTKSNFSPSMSGEKGMGRQIGPSLMVVQRQLDEGHGFREEC